MLDVDSSPHFTTVFLCRYEQSRSIKMEMIIQPFAIMRGRTRGMKSSPPSSMEGRRRRRNWRKRRRRWRRRRRSRRKRRWKMEGGDSGIGPQRRQSTHIFPSHRIPSVMSCRIPLPTASTIPSFMHLYLRGVEEGRREREVCN
jgi:hypothetical protein